MSDLRPSLYDFSKPMIFLAASRSNRATRSTHIDLMPPRSVVLGVDSLLLDDAVLEEINVKARSVDCEN